MSLLSQNFSVPFDENSEVVRRVDLNGEPVNLSIAPVVMVFDTTILGNSISPIQATISGADNNVATFVLDSSELFDGDQVDYKIEFQKSGDVDEISFGTIFINSDDTPYNSKIKYIHDLVNFYTDKGMTGFFNDDDIDNAIHAVQISLFRELMSSYAKTSQISSYLRCMQQSAVIDLSSGKGSTPDKFHIHTEMYTDDNTEIDVVESQDIRKRLKHPIKSPSEEYPLCILNSSYIEVFPSSILSVNMKYIKTPEKPRYAVTISSGRKVFDNKRSVDIEFPESLLDVIADSTLIKLGINLKDNDMFQLGSIEKNQKSK